MRLEKLINNPPVDKYEMLLNGNYIIEELEKDIEILEGELRGVPKEHDDFEYLYSKLTMFRLLEDLLNYTDDLKAAYEDVVEPSNDYMNWGN